MYRVYYTCTADYAHNDTVPILPQYGLALAAPCVEYLCAPGPAAGWGAGWTCPCPDIGLAIPVGPVGVWPLRIAAGPLGAFGTGRAVLAIG